MHLAIDPSRCVACLACVRVCPTDAIALPPEARVVEIVDENCILCGECLPSCPHDAITATGAVDRALAIAEAGSGALILAPEAVAHFHPATPEQLVNACYEAGFRLVSRGIIGDELVAQEYLKLWEDPDWGTIVRSTDPVVVAAITAHYPELVPYLAPVTNPCVAEARFLRRLHGEGLPVVYAGVSAPGLVPELDAMMTFGDLEQLFALREVRPESLPKSFSRLPHETRRHMSVAGGLPLEVVVSGSSRGRRLLTIRGLEGLPALARAVGHDRIDLGFVDILSHQGALGHPAAGPKQDLYRRRMLVQQFEPARSRTPVVPDAPPVSVNAAFPFGVRREQADVTATAAILEAIGTGPNGRSWDCRACGYASCHRFAQAAAMGRASLKQCVPWLARRAEDASRDASTDALTGLASYRSLQQRLSHEMERSKRSGDSFAVLFLDLDKLKELNDRYGHERGNLVLRVVADEMRRSIRATDMAARYGGDEFVALLTRTDRAGALRVADAVRDRVEQSGRRLGFLSGQITVSIGVAEYDPSAPGEGALLEQADRALYLAKSAGRNNIA
ncbi:MAG TPA: diguanylate cyclase [Gemmatimonadales bacterium]|jgi:diguanylate cyclase (GGDEF)-like protein|nr:diguanylate cyclase [Gemmatimonadales bacterium]